MAQATTFEAFERDIALSQPSADSRRAISNSARPIDLGAGSAAPLDQGAGMLVYIREGATKLIASASGGREQIVAFHFAGDLVSIPANAWHTYTLSALGQTAALSFRTADFLRITRADPAFSGVLLERTLLALFRSRDKAVGLGRKSARERVASFLIEMADRIGSKSSEGHTLDLPMSRGDIGDSLGLTIETVSRQFGILRDAQLVETIGRSRVILLDPAALAKQAGHV